MALSRDFIAAVCATMALLIGVGYLTAYIVHKNGWGLDRHFYRSQARVHSLTLTTYVAAIAYLNWPSWHLPLIAGAAYIVALAIIYGLIVLLLKPSQPKADAPANEAAASPGVWNERTKLLANALDRAGTACFTVGVATPLVGYLYRVTDVSARVEPAELALLLGFWLSACAIFHALARRVLGGLKG